MYTMPTLDEYTDNKTEELIEELADEWSQEEQDSAKAVVVDAMRISSFVDWFKELASRNDNGFDKAEFADFDEEVDGEIRIGLIAHGLL